VFGNGINFRSPFGMILDDDNHSVLVIDLELEAVVQVDVKPNPNSNPVVASGDRVILLK